MDCAMVASRRRKAGTPEEREKLRKHEPVDYKIREVARENQKYLTEEEEEAGFLVTCPSKKPRAAPAVEMVMDRNGKERLGSDVTSAEINPFQDCVSWCHLQDIPAIGSYFTWNKKQGVETRVYSRIDRILVNSEWIARFPNAFANFLPEGLYDHCPCIVQFEADIRRSRAPFKYYNMWSLSPGFDDMVKECWRQDVEGTKIFQVVSKMKSLKGQLKKLNKNEFNDIENNSSITVMALTQIQKNLRASPMDPDLIAAERALSQDYALMLKAKHMFLMQKSKAEWAVDGDDNTAYFYASIRSRRSRNKVIQIVI
ncbi:uncharacterized protein LOC141620319 [Silene latifolia]|uniref:uncharacterized protein LOC141620319 n=1 Tax=Silene latifolia TaxID=37657 RepID=UPI003D76B538